MTFANLVDTETLCSHLDDPRWLVFDCRHSLQDHGLGRRQYEARHIPTALYAHLEEDLSGPIRPGITGRHPLPEPVEFARWMAGYGLTEKTQVVVYDDSGGAIAARLWWMLKWIGHEAVAVLDGGWSKWQSEQRPARSGREPFRTGHFNPRIDPELVRSTQEVLGTLRDGTGILWDARAGERYRGELEPIDPVAGHIKGAGSVPYAENLREDGTFRSAAALRARFLGLLDGESFSDVICYCGSGVTAAHNILAVSVAGLGRPRLYAGSWSRWITDPSNPTETGPEPKSRRSDQ